MGQLTNQFVSQSYQGLLNLENANTGVTATLQYVTDGVGNRIPMQVSTSSIVITGSFRGDGSGLTGITANVDSGSLVTTASFNAYTSSNNARVNALEVETGSLQLQINQKLDTGSFNSYTSSNDARVNSLVSATGSYATTSSLTALSQSVAATDLAQDNRLNSIESITGSFATTSSLTSLSSSIAATDLAQDNRLSSLETNSGSQQLQINQKLDTGSFNSYTSSNNARINSLESKTGSYATTGSNVFNGTQTISGSLNVTGTITALSASITYLETIFQTSSVLFSSGSNILGDEASDTQTLFGTVRLPNGPLVVTGSVRATNFTGSLQGNATTATSASQAQNSVSASQAQNAVSASFAATATNALNLGGVAASSYARRNATNTFTADQTINSGSSLIVNEIISNAGDRLLILSDGSVSGPGARIIIGDTPSGGDPNVISDTTVSITGSLGVSGGITSPNFTGLASNSTQLGGRGVAQFVLTGSFNTYTSSNDTRVNSLINATSSYVTETESGSFMTTGSVSGNVLTFTKGDGSTFNLSVDTGSVTPINTGSFMITGSVSGATSTFTKGDGSTFDLTVNNVQSSSHAINADTASFLLGTIASASFAENANTASYARDIFLVGKNTTGGQLVKGTVVRIGGSTGDQALIVTASWEDDNNSANTLGILSQTLNNDESGSVITNGTFIGLNTSGMTAGDILFLSSSGQYTNVKPPAPYHEVRLGQVLRVQQNNGSAYVQIQNGYELEELHDVDITSPVNGDLLVYRSGSYGQWVNETGGELGFATTGSNTFIGNQTITGSIDVSGRSSLNGPLSSTDSFIKLFTTASLGGVVQPGQFITASAPVSQSNIVFANIQGINGQSALLPGQTGSIEISGSNNILFTSNRPVSAGLVGYLNNSNIVNNIPTLNTGSSYRPAVSNNLLYGGLTMTMGSGSGQFNIANTLLYGTLTLNVPSASLGGTYNNNIIAGTVTVQQTVPVTGSAAHSVQQNIINGTVSVQINSGSFTSVNNSINGVVQITGSYLSTGATANNLSAFNANTINGINHRFIFGGVGNGTKNFRDNLIGGTLFTGSIVANNQEGIGSFMAFGRGLYAEGGLPGGADTAGSTFLGRWNETGSLSNPGQYRFVIGNGTDAANRRTSLALDGPLNTFIFNSNINQTGSLNISGSIHNIIGSTNITGTTIMTGSFAPLQVGGTILTKRLHFDGNPFNNDPASNLGAIRMDSFNRTLQYTNYDKAEISTQSFIDQIVNTGSLFTSTVFGSAYAGTVAKVEVINNNGTRRVEVQTDAMTVTGSLNVTGSATITGSIQGNVNNLTVSSNTASLNLNNGNFFQLQLTGSQNIRIEPSNIKPGQTVNIKLNTTGSGTVSFPTSVKQISGSAYVPSTGTTTDIITLISFDNSDLFLANVKNLI